MITNYLTITLIVLSVLLVISVLMQQMGSGLSSTFGGTGGSYHCLLYTSDAADE